MKILFIAVTVISIVCSTNAVASTAHDNELLRIGAVDSSYRYKNLDYAERFFEVLQTQLRTLLPLEVDEGVMVIGVEASPYSTKYIYRTNDIFSKEELANAKTHFNSSDIINSLCSAMYKNKYQRANNTIGYADYYDSNGTKITSIMLNKYKCS